MICMFLIGLLVPFLSATTNPSQVPLSAYFKAGTNFSLLSIAVFLKYKSSWLIRHLVRQLYHQLPEAQLFVTGFSRPVSKVVRPWRSEPQSMR